MYSQIVNRREACSQRLMMAFMLHDSGVAMMRARLRRNHPGATEQEISAQLNAWLLGRPGAPNGDSDVDPLCES